MWRNLKAWIELWLFCISPLIKIKILLKKKKTVGCLFCEWLTLLLLQSLLCDPNPNSPANSEAARMFSENKREYNRRVREIVEQSWTADWFYGRKMFLRTSDQEHHVSSMLYLWIETSSLKLYIMELTFVWSWYSGKVYCLIVICCIALTSSCKIWMCILV